MTSGPCDLENNSAYHAWHDRNLSRPPATLDDLLVEVDGHLPMRYTMRKRNVVWKQDPLLKEVVTWLAALLNSRLKSGSAPLYRARHYDHIAGM